MAWKIKYLASAQKEAKKIDPQRRRNIQKYLEKRVAGLSSPRDLGEPLTGNLVGLWRYRVGDCRIVCEIQEERLVVLVVRIAHRRRVYGGH